MSRLHKKKPAGEKKKKTRNTPEQVGADGTISKPAASAGPVKSKPEKKITEPVTEPNSIQRAVEFFREVKVELKKVTWPTRKQTTGTTVVVIIFVFIVAAFLGLFDFGLSQLVQVVLA